MQGPEGNRKRIDERGHREVIRVVQAENEQKYRRIL